MGRILKYKKTGETDLKTMNKSKVIAISDVKTVARIFLSFDSMTHKKLQKLTYYAYAQFLAAFNGKVKLFNSRYKAWIHGPVCPQLHSMYSQYGVNDIIPRVIDHECNNKNLVGYLTAIYEVYGKYSADELEKMSHEERPWIIARDGANEYQYSNNTIRDEYIIEYY